MKSIDTRYAGSMNYLVKSLFISIVAFSAFITFSYLVDSDPSNLGKASKLVLGVDHTTYFLEANSDSSDKNKRYINNLLCLVSLNDGVNKNTNLFTNSLSELHVLENIYFIFSPLRSPPSV